MPCSDHGYGDAENARQLGNYKINCAWLEGALCTLINHMDENLKWDVTRELTLVGESGKIDLITWWENHKQSDIDRMEEKLETFSADELKIMKTILNSQEL